MSPNSPKAMILAAGLGTRLRPLTNATPKALLLVGGEPLIFYGIRLLKRHGVREVLINLHHLGDLIEKEVGDGSRFGLKVSYSWEPTILGTGGGVRKVAGFFKAPFFVLNSDILIECDLKALFRFHKKKRGIATMVLRMRDEGSPFTQVQVGRSDRIIGFGEQDTLKKSGIFTGVQILDPKILAYLPPEGEACLIRQGYQPAIEAGEKVFGLFTEGYWNDLGTLERYRQAEQDIASGKIRLTSG